MLDEMTTRQRYGLVVTAVVLLAVGFGAGAVFNGGTLTGNLVADGDTASEDEIRQSVQELMDQQMQSQQQQFQMMAQQSENLSVDDLSMDATVTDVSASEFGSLYRVTVSIEGQAPGQMGRIQQIDEEQEMFISSDGRYLFQPPTDLEQPQQAPQ
ncbi:MAG: hypothetical protein MUP63_02185 [Candidatus Nanohaloarchaeota archaeon QJJ-7]|nr:hypothetical protein [Candidatus Nanohaloarchaeota archaeon QJJ-7]